MEPGQARAGARSSALFYFSRFLRGSRVLLWGVGLVVVLVSLPLLKAVALRENELDALRALGLLSPEVFAASGQTQDFNQLFDGRAMLGRRLPDTRLLDEGRVMFHHGYLFEIVPTEGGQRWLRAWPMNHGQSGLGAFWCDGSGKVLGHPNYRAQWSGVAAPPLWPGRLHEPNSRAGWRMLDVPGLQSRSGI